MDKNLSNLWGIVLAGGEGTRLQNLVRRIYGYDRPKQYCTFVGTRSLLRHTIDRAAMLIPHKRILAVVNRSHSEYVLEELGVNPSIEIMEQPAPRETGAGILLPMLKVNNNDPNSTIALFPSDHFILDEQRFMDYVKKAAEFVNNNPDAIVMLGVHSGSVESGYGWIEPDQKINSQSGMNVFSVKRFWEKPSSNVTRYLVNKGCMINTFVLIGKSSAFLYYMAKNMPELYSAFGPIKSRLGTPLEKIMITRTYKYLPMLNFSRSVLENICRHLVVMEMNDVYWSDWGEEYRLNHDVEIINAAVEETAFAF